MEECQWDNKEMKVKKHKFDTHSCILNIKKAETLERHDNLNDYLPDNMNMLKLGT